jgi:hypothetical protein
VTRRRPRPVSGRAAPADPRARRAAWRAMVATVADVEAGAPGQRFGASPPGRQVEARPEAVELRVPLDQSAHAGDAAVRAGDQVSECGVCFLPSLGGIEEADELGDFDADAAGQRPLAQRARGTDQAATAERLLCEFGPIVVGNDRAVAGECPEQVDQAPGEQQVAEAAAEPDREVQRRRRARAMGVATGWRLRQGRVRDGRLPRGPPCVGRGVLRRGRGSGRSRAGAPQPVPDPSLAGIAGDAGNRVGPQGWLRHAGSQARPPLRGCSAGQGIASRAGLVRPKMPRVGTPSAAARCIRPESLATIALHWAIRRAVSASARGVVASWTCAGQRIGVAK